MVISVIAALLLAAYVAISIRNRHISIWQIVSLSFITLLVAGAMTYGFMQRSNATSSAFSKAAAESQP